MTLFARHGRFIPPAVARAGTSQRNVPTLNRNNRREEARTPRAERLRESNPALANAALTGHTCQRNGEREYQALRRDTGRITRRGARHERLLVVKRGVCNARSAHRNRGNTS